MTRRLDQIRRFPIKSHGRESVAHAVLAPGRGLPHPRRRAVTHESGLGAARLRLVDRSGPCLATHNNPETGARDATLPGALDTLGHRDLTVRAEVIEGGRIAPGDSVRRL